MVEGFDVDAPDFRALFSRVREVEPRLVTSLRRELRRSGDDIIAAQKQELGDGDVRDQIAAGLRTRVTAGTTRQSIGITTSGPRVGGASLAKVFERGEFRHPVFGTDEWVDQSGHPYFNKPVKSGFEAMRQRIETVVDDVLRKVAG